MLNRKLNYLLGFVRSAFIMGGCGSNKGNNGSPNNSYCDGYNCYNQGNYDNYYAKGVVVTSGLLAVTNGDTWKSVMDTMVNCRQEYVFFNISYCGSMSNGGIVLSVQVNDYTFSGPNRTSTGQVTIGSQNGPLQYYPVSWQRTSDGSSYSTYLWKNFTSSYSIGNADRVRIVVYGKVTESSNQAAVIYGNTEVGRGQIYRTNRTY